MFVCSFVDLLVWLVGCGCVLVCSCAGWCVCERVLCVCLFVRLFRCFYVCVCLLVSMLVCASVCLSARLLACVC